jgi:hypothetical protein
MLVADFFSRRLINYHCLFFFFRYVLLGALYLVIVHRRSRLYLEEAKQLDLTHPPEPEDARGLPRHYGIFYAIGIWLWRGRVWVFL